jgi:hypothetical protein
MLRNPTSLAMLTVVTIVLAGSSADAQSPPPGQLAPGASGTMIAPQGQAPSPQPRSAVPDAAPGGNTVQAPIAPPAPPVRSQASPKK